MQPLTYIAVYFVLWWLCLFMVLPFGVRGQHENGAVTDGTDPGAPERPYLLLKLAATTVLSLVVLVLVMWGLSNETLQNYWGR